MRDNHGPTADRWRSAVRGNACQPKFPRVEAVLYANCLKIAFEDGIYRYKLYNNPASWRYVGVINTPDGRIVKCARDSDAMVRKLNLEHGRLIKQGVSASKPQVYRMFIKVAEKIQENLSEVSA